MNKYFIAKIAMYLGAIMWFILGFILIFDHTFNPSKIIVMLSFLLSALYFHHLYKQFESKEKEKRKQS